MKSKIFLFTLVGIFFIGCYGQTSKAIETIDSKEFAKKLKSAENPQLLDVRTPEEFSTGRIGNATNANWNGNDFAAKAEKLDKTKPVFVYCKAGGRSAEAADELAKMGFTKIYNLEGGIMKWNASQNSKSSGKIVGICDQEYAELIKSSPKVLVDFNAKWCGPCKKMKPYLEKLQVEMKDKIKIVPIDSDENSTITEQMHIEGLPTLIIYENGKEVWRHLGYISEEELLKHL